MSRKEYLRNYFKEYNKQPWRKKYLRNYGKKYSEIYRQTEKGKKTHTEANQRDWIKNKSKRQIQKKNWDQSERGKMANKKYQANRGRKLNWILMFPNPFADSIEIEYHHITDAYVVVIPKDLHKLFSGYKQNKHRELLMPIIKQIYLGD